MLRESDELYRLLAENSTDMISKHTIAGVYTYVSPACRSLLGYEPEDLVGRSVYDFFHPEDVGRIKDNHSMVLEHRDAYTVDYRMRRKDGTYTYFETTGRAVREPRSGHVLELIAVSRDVTERKRADEALKASEERYRALYEDNPTMYFTLDGRGTLLSVNRFGAERLGYAPDELVGRSILDLFHEDDRELVSRHVDALLRGPERLGVWEARKARKDGSVLWVEETARVVEGPDGKRTVLLVCADVTERKRAEETLRESEERYRAFFENAAVGAVEADLVTGRFLRANEKFCRFLGYGRDELLTRTFLEVTHPEDRAGDAEGVARLLRGEIREYVTEKRYLRRGGGVAWTQLAVALVRDGRGRPLHSVAITQDLTERKRVEEALAREVLAKSDFLAEVSHELRTPLTVIRGSADVGLELARGWPHADLLREIREEASMMSRMVEDLLFLARSDSDSPPLDLETIPVARLLGGLARRAEALAREHGSSLRTELGGEGRLTCDAGRIEQATLVLVDNAVKYGPRGGCVTLSSSTRGDELFVEVADRGPGIPPEELSRIFERFYRCEGSSEGRGSGLGLPIARTIVRAHGGELEAESLVGQGTRMSLRLPLHNVP